MMSGIAITFWLFFLGMIIDVLVALRNIEKGWEMNDWRFVGIARMMLMFSLMNVTGMVVCLALLVRSM